MIWLLILIGWWIFYLIQLFSALFSLNAVSFVLWLVLGGILTWFINFICQTGMEKANEPKQAITMPVVKNTSPKWKIEITDIKQNNQAYTENIVDDKGVEKEKVKKYSMLPIIVWLTVIGFLIWVVASYGRLTNTPQTYQNNPSNSFISSSTDTGNGDVQGDTEIPTMTPEPTKTYYETARIGFLENCYKTSGGRISSCNCLLNYLESKYSISEFARIEDEYRQTNKLPQEMINALADGLAYCKDK